MRRVFQSLEALEVRIAPALFFVNSAASGAGHLTVQTASGANAEDTAAEMSAQTEAVSTTAILLSAGDKLIFDATTIINSTLGIRS